MPGSYFQTETYGVTAIDLASITTTEQYLGSATGLKSSISTAKALDLRADNQTYSLKQVFQAIKAGKVTYSADESLVINLYSKSASSTLATTNKIASFTVSLEDIVNGGTVGFETTLPSNCKRYVAIGIAKAGSATLTGKLLFTNKPIR